MAGDYGRCLTAPATHERSLLRVSALRVGIAIAARADWV
jgi:hypothetical protein